MGRIRRCALGAAIGLAVFAPPSVGVRGSVLAQPPEAYPVCTGTALAGFPWTHRAFGKAIPGIALRNMTLDTCRVAGFVGVRAYQQSGRPADIRIERRMLIDSTIFAYSVRPGAAVFFAFYGHAPSGEFDRSCVGITQVDITLPGDRHPIDVTLASGTCGGRMTVSQMFPAGELAH